MNANDRLYALLPALYRERDAAEGYPLRALLAVIAEQATVLEDDLDQLYDDLFIETCADWVVPYLGALVGVSDPEAGRAEVANTLAYRRRKGTAAVLEQLARDITGWPSSVVEYFQRLATTQYLNHPRPAHRSMAEVRRPRLLGTPFDTLPRTVEVRRIASERGRFNIPNIGLHCWRIAAHPVTLAPAFALDAWRFRFDVCGRDLRLFNRPEPEREISHHAEPWNVPLPLSRALLAEHPERYFGRVLAIEVDGVPVEPGPGQHWRDVIASCNLMDFEGGWANLPTARLAVDPELGRLAFPASATPSEVRVSYHHGFSARIGGGEYPRLEGFAAGPVIRVPNDHTTVQAALDAIMSLLDASDTPAGSVEIGDSEIYAEALQLAVPAGKSVELRAAEGRRPLLALTADAVLGGGDGAEIRLNGLLIAGAALRAPTLIDGNPNGLRALTLRHCTLTPGATDFDADPTPIPRMHVDTPCAVHLDRCISGALRLGERVELTLDDSIVDAGASDALALAATDSRPTGLATVRASTVIGRVHVLELDADNTLFHAAGAAPAVRVDRLQRGCVRFCWVPPESITPHRFRCLPDADHPRERPNFISLVWGDPGYARLANLGTAALRAGAETGGEIGAFHHLFETRAAMRLRRNLPEYLRLSLEAGVFFES